MGLAFGTRPLGAGAMLQSAELSLEGRDLAVAIFEVTRTVGQHHHLVGEPVLAILAGLGDLGGEGRVLADPGIEGGQARHVRPARQAGQRLALTDFVGDELRELRGAAPRPLDAATTPDPYGEAQRLIKLRLQPPPTDHHPARGQTGGGIEDVCQKLTA